jgi:hypothetical protein
MQKDKRTLSAEALQVSCTLLNRDDGAISVRVNIPGERIEDEVRLSPILAPPDEQHVRNISRLPAWQKLSRSAAIPVQFP